MIPITENFAANKSKRLNYANKIYKEKLTSDFDKFTVYKLFKKVRCEIHIRWIEKTNLMNDIKNE